MANFIPGQDFYVYTIDDWITFASYTSNFNTLTHVYIMNDIDFSTYVDDYGHPINCPNFYRDQESNVFIHGNGHAISNMYFIDVTAYFNMLGPNLNTSYHSASSVQLTVEHLTIKDFFIICKDFKATYRYTDARYMVSYNSMYLEDFNLFGVVHTNSHADDFGRGAIFSICKSISNCQFDLKWINSNSGNAWIVLFPTGYTILNNIYTKLTLIGYHNQFSFGQYVNVAGNIYTFTYLYMINCVIELHLENLQPGSRIGMIPASSNERSLPFFLLVLIESAPRDMTNTEIYISGKQTAGRLTFYDKTKTDEMGITILTFKDDCPAIGETTEHLKDGVYMYEHYGVISD
jgi:hypothetical protein